MKPKINRAGDTNESRGYDRCATPSYALDPLLLLSCMRTNQVVWECAAGTGTLVRALERAGHTVVASDIHGEYADPPLNFFDDVPDGVDVIVTNPPYSVKYDWLERCYAIGKPFALLVPVEMIGAQRAQRCMERYGAELLLLNRRVNFAMPNKGWVGSAAQFPVLWLCHGLLPSTIVYGRITPRHENQLELDL